MSGLALATAVVTPGLVAAWTHRPTRTTGLAPPRTAWWRRLHAARRAARQRRRVEATLPDTIDLLVLAVRSGLLPLQAFRLLRPHLDPDTGDAVDELLAEIDRGARFADALTLLAHRLGPALHPLVDGFVAADRDGLPLAPVLERLSADARAQRRRRVDAVARELPVRLAAPLVVCSLPAFVLLGVVPLLLAAFASLHR